VVVPEHAKGRADGRGAAFVRADLHEVIFQRRRLPGGLVHAAIDLDVAASSPRRMRGAHERRLWRQRLLLRDCRRCRREQQQGCAHLRGKDGEAGG
jgi:hypothetical protein